MNLSTWLFSGMIVGLLVGHITGNSKSVSTRARGFELPLIDREALAAHADSVGVPRAAAYALAWQETRTGRCLPKCPRGQGIIVLDSTVFVVVDPKPGFIYFTHHICREVGRMQINPCSRLEKKNPRCEFKRIRDNLDDNYACGLWYYSTLRKDGERKALSRYNGGNPQYAMEALAQTGDWWFAGLLTEEDR